MEDSLPREEESSIAVVVHPPTTTVAVAIKKRKSKTVVVDDSGSTNQQQPWFSRKHRINSRNQVCINDSTGEADILSLAVHSGITTDEALTEFMVRETTLSILDSIMKSAVSRSSKITTNKDGTVVTRYYNPMTHQIPTNPDGRISYQPSPEGKPCRWAIRGFLVTGLCNLLDETQRDGVSAVAISDTANITDEEAGGGGITSTATTMVSFRGQRRNLLLIPMSEIEAAEREVMTSQGIALMRELIGIRRMHHTNCEKGIIALSAKMREVEGSVLVERMIRDREVTALAAEKDKEIAARSLEVSTVKAESENIKCRNILRSEEQAVRQTIVSEYNDDIMNTVWRLLVKCHNSSCVRPKQQLLETAVPVDDTSASLRRDLEDAKLEIERLKNDARGKAVPKPKAHRATKDPEIHLATETDIRNSVRTHLSLRGGGACTPASSSMGGGCGSVTTAAAALRARRRIGGGYTHSVGEVRALEEREIEAGHKLRALSRSREQDLCNAETESKQLIEVIQALSSILTRVTLTIEDISSRRTAILNHMRSLAMHSRSITSLIRERPYLLSLARRMNHERRPVVNLDSLRSLINVAESNFKCLKEIESITLESVGGAFEVMSLEEAASSTLEEETWMDDIPPPPLITDHQVSVSSSKSPDYSPMKVLTRATLYRYTKGKDDDSSSVGEDRTD